MNKRKQKSKRRSQGNSSPVMSRNSAAPELAEGSRRAGGDRNRRMFADLRKSLGGSGASPLPGSSRAPRQPKVAEEDPLDKLDDLDSIINQIADLSVRPDRSAAQIKRNIANSSYLSQMSEEEWTKLARTLVDMALNNGEGEFAADIFSTLLAYDEFGDAISTYLREICSAYIMEGNDDSGRIPTFLGTILCSHWPRHMSKAIDSVNIILFYAVSIIKGWIVVLQEDNTAEIAQKLPNLPPDSEDDEEEDEEEVLEREDPEIVNRCASAIATLCESTQRSLWMKWPELCDEIYQAIKPTITHNTKITGSVKSDLLHTLITMQAWTKTKAVTTKSASTQTV